MDQPYTLEEDGICLAVRATPRASRSEVSGLIVGADGRPALAVRLAAPPVDGTANKALVELLARFFQVPKSSVTIRSGDTARLKRVMIAGEAEALVGKLEGV